MIRICHLYLRKLQDQKVHKLSVPHKIYYKFVSINEQNDPECIQPFTPPNASYFLVGYHLVNAPNQLAQNAQILYVWTVWVLKLGVGNLWPPGGMQSARPFYPAARKFIQAKTESLEK